LFEFRSAEDLQIWLEPLRHRSMLRIQQQAHEPRSNSSAILGLAASL
jgi:hypothetical protein